MENLMDRITIDPNVCGGKPTIRGKRITVQTILEFLSAGDSMDEILHQYPSINEDDITESFQNRSYSLWTNILLAARSDLRPLLEHYWPLISLVSNQEVIADNPSDLLLWRIKDEGHLLDLFPDATQSWAKLVDLSHQDMDEFLPDEIKNRKYLIPFWIITMPHRCTYKTTLAMLNGK